jgi:hypothetical protein
MNRSGEDLPAPGCRINPMGKGLIIFGLSHFVDVNRFINNIIRAE